VQDLGRFGYRASGVPVSGVADRDSALTLNALLGNEPNAAMIEVAVAGGAFEFDSAATIAIGGADVECSVDGRSVNPWNVTEVSAGETLVLHRIVRGRFVLIAVRGGIAVPHVLGSRSTLLSAKFGGFEGRRLREGDRLPVGEMTVRGRGDTASSQLFISDADAIRIVRGPQADLFEARAWSAFLSTAFTISRASDRSGYRLEGATLEHAGPPAMPSEPACVGAIQVPDGGSPIVIMHDGPTVGGYPKIAVVKSSDISRFAQLAPGDTVKFALI
jgi:antagonist of KipI